MKAKYIISLFLLFFSAACSEDNLFQDPATALSDETILESKETVSTVLMGAYTQTGSYRYLTIGEISLDVMGNDLKMTDGSYNFSTYNWLMYAYNYTQYPRVVDGWWSAYAPYLWDYAYRAIDQCNLIINANNLPEGCEDILAQAHGIRGYNFLNLYHLFCHSYTYAGDEGQGLFLRLTSGSADGNNVPRSNLGTSMKQIIDDFTYAYEYGSETSGNYYINKKNAALLLARTYLDMGDYANAQKYAEIASPVFDGSNLMSKEEYQSGFSTANSEWLWGYNFTSETSNIYASIPSFYHAGEFKDASSTFGTAEYGTKATYDYLVANAVDWMTGYSTVRVNWSFAKSFGKDDCRALFPFYIEEKDGLFTSKYTSKGSLGVADYPLARIAEAYLIEAECLARKSDPEALKILNTLQAKRGGTLSTAISVDEVWYERRRELYGEGFALPDIKRLQKPLERVGDEHWSTVKTLPANSPRMMFPIPAEELDYNKNTTEADQNEYWK
ncbi:SusD family protein [Bacteroidales bacterium Barb6XT]|nr:SusD family protein [Bacteroidales bacterium Barb6XT]